MAAHPQQRIAVVGAGISGLATAWLLSRRYQVTLFEAGDTLGGHTNTVDVTLEGKTHPVDTGFLVFNERTYPNLIALFDELGVASVETEMSFAVSLEKPDLEWAGSNLATVFGQKRNLLRRRFWGMLSDILRFNRESTTWLASHPDDRRSLRDFLVAGCYSAAFSDWYLLPMAAAIWSCPTGQMLDMPLATFIRFCHNHGLLQIFDRPTWRTVQGGGREYVRRIAAQLADVRVSCPVRAIERTADGLQVHHAHGVERFDQVVSIEMFEAVGERWWPTYFSGVARALRPGGRAVVQSITIRDDLFSSYRRGTDFIQQYIFPGGMLPSRSAFRSAAARQGLAVVDEYAFGPDYARTLAEWRQAFETNWPRIAELGFDETFRRLWRFYLCYCEAGFLAGNIDVVQFELRHR